ncbi:MAG: ABC transporter substrate-binding protein [Chromatiaceae bacterium]|nr:ABC transporter substrate-binding protein [Gammaproteobacteria bacterium]MCB1871590.1 ABC transporter substrate-binding protein [Gammaproteobacteria bacterium]MCB1881751.1 ABC transporter substrate-binding protein [Gammaproteobacteria bacterium]MCP5427701.1 ABC transporter substrate-binding protein [Chromatiaceae bacterium]MCP5447462.1 ABC transporter substrate-binding protein [Chromatiaceae bacterium]
MSINSALRPLLITAALLLAATLPVIAAERSVRITAIVEHPALDAVRQGILDELRQHGYLPGDNLDWEFQSAQGDAGIAGQIARKFVGDAPDAIVAIATPSAQAVAAAAHGTLPVIFSAVTDPLDARLVDNLERPGGNVTGVSDLLPLEQHLALIREIVPDAGAVGIPYNPGEANAAVLVKRIEAMAPGLGLKIVTASAPTTGDVLMAARSLVGKVDVIYVTTDNTVIAAFESVLKVGREAQIPVIAGDTDTVSRGAVAAVGFDYYDVGRQTGVLLLRVLNGEHPGDIAVRGVEKTRLHLNPASARTMGVELSSGLIQRAARIVE